jgi:serine/threonine protein kinase
MKIVDKSRLDGDTLNKLYREMTILKRVRHPHVVRVYETIDTPTHAYIAMEYAPNGELFC